MKMSCQTNNNRKNQSSPSDIALTNIVEARMKMIRDALPNTIISLLTICWPISAAIVATAVK